MVSIIVPIYNSGKQLKKCVKSLLCQSYANIEIILVNDGSTDSSGVICDELAASDSRIKVIHKKNGGVSAARNTGLDNATGKYVMFCDSDDYVDKDWCLELVKCAEAHPGHMPFCDIVKMLGEVETEHFKMPDYDRESGNSYELNLEKLIEVDRAILLYNPVNKLFDLSIINNHNIRFDTAVSLGEDGLFNLNYLYYLGGKTAYMPKKLYFYVDSNPVSLSKAGRIAHAKSVRLLFSAYEILLSKLNCSDDTTTIEMCSFFYGDLLQGALDSAVDTSTPKLHRIKAISTYILNSEFKRARKKAKPPENDYMLYKLAKSRTLLVILLIWKKVLKND